MLRECNLLKLVPHFGGLMFNINFLGSPGIQPDIVSNYVSYRPEDEKNVKNIVLKDEPGFFTKIIDYVPSKSDYASFLMLCLIISLFLYLRPTEDKSHRKTNINNSLYVNPLDLNESYSVLRKLIDDIKNNNDIKFIKIVNDNSFMNFKLISLSGFDGLNSFSRNLKNKYGLTSRINGDSLSNFILTTSMPWEVYDGSGGFERIQNFGQDEYILFIIDDLIENKILHKGNLQIDIKEDNNYFIKFYPVNVDS